MRTQQNSCVLWAATLVSIGLFAGGARATLYSEQYEMTSSPDTVAGTVNGFTLNGGAAGSGSTFSGGIMTFLDNTTSGNYGYYLAPSSTLLIGSTAYLADFRITVLQDNAPATGKLMSFKSNSQGRGLDMDTGAVTFVNGSGAIGSGSVFNFNADFVECRVIIDGSAAHTG